MTMRKTLAERADLEDVAAERAMAVARHVEAEGYFIGADMYWKLANRCRVEGLRLRALAEARKIQGRRPRGFA
jgi:hypothetical protein